MLTRCVMSTFDCGTRTPRQSSQPCVGNCERHFSQCSQTVERALRSSLGDWRIFPIRGSTVPVYHKDLETYILVHGEIFFKSGPRGGAKECTESAAR